MDGMRNIVFGMLLNDGNRNREVPVNNNHSVQMPVYPAVVLNAAPMIGQHNNGLQFHQYASGVRRQEPINQQFAIVLPAYGIDQQTNRPPPPPLSYGSGINGLNNVSVIPVAVLNAPAPIRQLNNGLQFHQYAAGVNHQDQGNQQVLNFAALLNQYAAGAYRQMPVNQQLVNSVPGIFVPTTPSQLIDGVGLNELITFLIHSFNPPVVSNAASRTVQQSNGTSQMNQCNAPLMPANQPSANSEAARATVQQSNPLPSLRPMQGSEVVSLDNAIIYLARAMENGILAQAHPDSLSPFLQYNQAGTNRMAANPGSSISFENFLTTPQNSAAWRSLISLFLRAIPPAVVQNIANEESQARVNGVGNSSNISRGVQYLINQFLLAIPQLVTSNQVQVQRENAVQPPVPPPPSAQVAPSDSSFVPYQRQADAAGHETDASNPPVASSRKGKDATNKKPREGSGQDADDEMDEMEDNSDEAPQELDANSDNKDASSVASQRDVEEEDDDVQFIEEIPDSALRHAVKRKATPTDDHHFQKNKK